METTEFEKKFLRKWSELSARGNAVEYDRAVLVREAREKLGDKLRELLRKGLGLGPIAVSHAYVQADALGVVADKAVWVAGGWRAVRLIVAAESNDTRRLIGKAVLNESDLRGGPLSAGGVRKVVERVAPGLIERTKRSREPQVPSRPRRAPRTCDASADVVAGGPSPLARSQVETRRCLPRRWAADRPRAGELRCLCALKCSPEAV